LRIEKKALNVLHDNLAFRRRVRVLANLVARELRDGRTVLDLGCGDGSIAKAVMNERPEYAFRGLDVFRRPQTWIPVDVFDGRTIPFPDRSFDWVTVVDVLHHTDTPGELLAEAARVSRLGVILKDHLCNGFAAYPTLRFMDWVGNRGHDVTLVYNYLSRGEWERIFTNVSLKAATWMEDLHLYPAPFNFVFDRNLHFVATLVPNRH
jgi:ubiquinone/menaquinone biosynthesis C-methylase UbiE